MTRVLAVPAVLIAVVFLPSLSAREALEDSPASVVPAAPTRDPDVVFRKACEIVAKLEGKHPLLTGISKAKPSVQREQKKRLESARLVFENNALPPGKNAARARDNSKSFFYVSIEVWSGRSQAPPANLHEFTWQGQTYQMWVRIYGSDAALVKMVRKSVDEALRGPAPAEAKSSHRWPGATSSLEALAPVTDSVLAAVAKERAEIKSRSAAHLSTRTSLRNGESIAGGGYVFHAQCRQQFQILEVLHGQGKPGDRFLEYGFVEKTRGFPLPATQEPIPAGAKVIVLLGKNGSFLKALDDTPENRQAVRGILSKRKEKSSQM